MASRAIWALVILGAMALFLALVGEKALTLMSHPKVINLQVEYQDSLDFPAVTICNTNLYR